MCQISRSLQLWEICLQYVFISQQNNMFVIFQSDISLRCSFPLTNTILFFKVGQGARATSVNGFFLDWTKISHGGKNIFIADVNYFWFKN